eukprot:TRINITY_DN182_c0_g1_i2.p1 TRINITY_DN182_c0_g1~~TRINITY_DN182_c0_g1_i2.p1  ORF type:complete len:1400 (+),score=682.28 TRINITY_DN182_c0_g1_i2:218-4417(+)
MQKSSIYICLLIVLLSIINLNNIEAQGIVLTDVAKGVVPILICVQPPPVGASIWTARWTTDNSNGDKIVVIKGVQNKFSVPEIGVEVNLNQPEVFERGRAATFFSTSFTTTISWTLGTTTITATKTSLRCGDAQDYVDYPCDPVQQPSAQNPYILKGVLRDFMAGGNFQKVVGAEYNLVEKELSIEGLPVLTAGNKQTILDVNQFREWFVDTPSNRRSEINIPLKPVTGKTGVFGYTNNSFFPLDNLRFSKGDAVFDEWYTTGGSKVKEGTSGAKNYHFTMEIRSAFTYQTGQTFTFSGDDDVWVYIDNKLVIDLGGVHSKLTKTVNLNTLGLVVGTTYNFDLFFAERHTSESNFQIETSLIFCKPIVKPDPPKPKAQPITISGCLLALEDGRNFAAFSYKNNDLLENVTILPGVNNSVIIDGIETVSADRILLFEAGNKTKVNAWAQPMNELGQICSDKCNEVEWSIVDPTGVRRTAKVTKTSNLCSLNVIPPRVSNKFDKPIIPILYCVEKIINGTQIYYRARWGYDNPNGDQIMIQPDSVNGLNWMSTTKNNANTNDTLGPVRGQPGIFLPGRWVNVFYTEWTDPNAVITWNLRTAIGEEDPSGPGASTLMRANAGPADSVSKCGGKLDCNENEYAENSDGSYRCFGVAPIPPPCRPIEISACINKEENGLITVRYDYISTNPIAVQIAKLPAPETNPNAAYNYFESSNADRKIYDRRQPIIFMPGQHHFVFYNTFNPTIEQSITWKIKGPLTDTERSLTITENTVECDLFPKADQSTIIEPLVECVTQNEDDTITVFWSYDGKALAAGTELVTVTVGRPNNFLYKSEGTLPSSITSGVSAFRKGVNTFVFFSKVSASNFPLMWDLTTGGVTRTATANEKSPICKGGLAISTPEVKPSIDCVFNNEDGTRLIRFGYENIGSRLMTAVNGTTTNWITGKISFRPEGVPVTIFAPGVINQALFVVFATDALDCGVGKVNSECPGWRIRSTNGAIHSVSINASQWNARNYANCAIFNQGTPCPAVIPTRDEVRGASVVHRFTPKLTVLGLTIDESEKSPVQMLGLPYDSVTNCGKSGDKPFVSLGFGGSSLLEFNAPFHTELTVWADFVAGVSINLAVKVEVSSTFAGPYWTVHQSASLLSLAKRDILGLLPQMRELVFANLTASIIANHPNAATNTIPKCFRYVRFTDVSVNLGLPYFIAGFPLTAVTSPFWCTSCPNSDGANVPGQESNCQINTTFSIQGTEGKSGTPLNPDAQGCYTIDNTDPIVELYPNPSVWRVSDDADQLIGNNYLTKANPLASVSGAIAVFKAPISGQLQVSARWIKSILFSSSVSVTVISSTTTTINVNQQTTGNTFVNVGTFTFNSQPDSATGTSTQSVQFRMPNLVNFNVDAVRFCPVA